MQAPRSADPYAPHTVAVYRFFDARGRLLYVGRSANPKRRFAKHAAEQPWWHEVDRWQVEWFPDGAAAAVEETQRIRRDEPLYNIVGQARPALSVAHQRLRPGGSITDVADVLGSDRQVRTLVVLARLSATRPAVYESWTPGALTAFLREHEVRVVKNSKGNMSVRSADVRAAVAKASSSPAAPVPAPPVAEQADTEVLLRGQRRPREVLAGVLARLRP